MYLQSIKIHKCKRFPLYGSDTLEINFENRLNMIDGRNGSGKSSLFSMLTPLPPDKNDFELGGYHLIHITNIGREYELKSDFSTKSGSYSFICDGEELNPAGIISRQRTLVLQHFNLTQALFDIMVGKEIFTDLTIGGRKKLFSTFTKLNIDHVLKSYGKLNEEFNLHKLMFKNEQKQELSIKQKLMDSQDFEEVTKTLKETNDNIDYLLDFRNNLTRYFNPESSESSMDDLRYLLNEKDKLIKDNYCLITTQPKKELERRKSDISSFISSNNTKLDFLYKDLEKLHDIKKSMIENEIEDVDSLTNTKESLKEEINSCIKGLLLVEYDRNKVFEVDRAFFKLYDVCRDVLSEMNPNIDSEGEYIFSRKKRDECLSKKEKLINEFHEIKAKERNIIDRSNKMKEMDESLTCPSCGEKWEIKDLIDQKSNEEILNHLRITAMEITSKVKEIDTYLQDCENYYRNYATIISVKKETVDKLPLFWKSVDDGDLLLKSPNEVVRLMETLQLDITFIKKIKEMEDDVISINERIKLLNNLKGDSLEGINEKITNVENDIFNLINHNRELNVELTKIDNASAVINTIAGIDRSINLTKDRVREYNLSVVTSSLMSIIDNQIRDLRVRSTELENIIHSQDSIKMTLKTIEDKLADIEETMGVLEIMLNELSPKSGIIAKTITSFLNTIIHNINKTLDRIWSYKMELVPIDLEHTDLNYRFKISVEDRLTVDDIMLASKGMKEAINLAFKLVLYKLYAFDNYPLYLDELASNMDEEHTDKMGKLVHTFAYESNFSQVFIISHKENMGYLKNMDVFSMS